MTKPLTKQRLAYSHEANGIRHNIVIVEAMFGWTVTFIENGVEVRKIEQVMGSLMTVMGDAISGML